MYSNRIKEIDALQKEINQYRPLKKKIVDELKEYYKIGLTYTSNALEGNSLTETETKIVLEDGITIGGKPLREHYEAVGAAEGYDFIYKLIKKETITEKDIFKLHKIFYYRIDVKKAGKYRKEQVFITGTDFIPPAPKEVPLLMHEFIQNIPKLKKDLHPVECAAIVHKDLATIHPFVDGNGRCARLLMNLILLQSGYVVTMIPPIIRSDYINALKNSQTNKMDNTLFINFISSMVYEAQKDYLRILNTLFS